MRGRRFELAGGKRWNWEGLSEQGGGNEGRCDDQDQTADTTGTGEISAIHWFGMIENRH